MSNPITAIFFPGTIINQDEFNEFENGLGNQGKNNLAERLVNMVKNHKNYDEIIKKVQVGRDGLPGAIRRIESIYHGFPYDWAGNKNDSMEMKCLLFFQYYKYLIEILKYSFPEFNIDIVLEEEITEIRNIFAHSYNKSLPGKKLKGDPAFIRLDLNPHFYQGINIEVFNISTGRKEANIQFSLDYYYLEFQKMVSNFISFIEKFI